MRARPSPRSGCSPRSGSTTSTPAPTWSTSTWDGCGRSSARMRPGRCAARGTRSRVAGGDRGRLDWPLRQLGWLEVAWVGFAVANLGGMWLVPTWETVPFHFIWISLTVVYGFRVWDLERTGWVLAALDALIENAVKQTEPGDEIRLGARREGGRVAVWVADSGPGIAPEQLEAIFDRFARLDVGRSRDRGGVGLGLAIVKAIAEAHGGSIRVRSALGRGSVFEVLLPAPLAPLEAAAR